MDIILKDVSKSFYGREFLKTTDINLKEHQIISVLGQNGSGKTTLMKEIIRRCGKLYDIAYVPQETHGDLSLKVREIVALGRYRGVMGGALSDKDNLLIDEAMEMTEIKTLADRLYDTLSGGEKQRVLTARAIAQDSTWIFLDEPSSHLDIRHTEILIRILRRLKGEKGKSVFVILHDVNKAFQISDEIILMKNGEILCTGMPDVDILGTAFDAVFEQGNDGFIKVVSVDI